MAVSPLACSSHGGLMEILNAMDVRRVADPCSSADVVAIQDDVPL